MYICYADEYTYQNHCNRPKFLTDMYIYLHNKYNDLNNHSNRANRHMRISRILSCLKLHSGVCTCYIILP